MKSIRECIGMIWRLLQSPGKAFRVEVDEDEIICCDDEGTITRIQWAKLDQISVTIADINLNSAGVLWALRSGTLTLLFPDDAEGAPAAIRHLTCIPGFSSDLYSAAFVNRKVEGQVVWKRKDTE